MIDVRFSNEDIKAKLFALRSHEITAEQNVQYYVDQIKHHNSDLNVFLSINEHALEQAKKVDEKIKAGTAGRLAGLAIAVKSAICVKGLEANCASKTLAGYIAPYDADAVCKIKEQDGIIIGMTNMDEFASGSGGEHSAFGPTKNPACPGKIPGGSSSGSAAAVTAGMCDLSLGTDTGGSIRNPASHCGVVGIKPSYGRVSRYGLIDLSMSLDQIGPFSMDVYGCALLLEVIAGKSAHDGTTLGQRVSSYSSLSPFKRKRIGIVKNFESVCAEKRIYDHVMRQIKQFAETHDCTLVDIELDHVELAIQAYYPIVYTEFYSGTRKFDGRKYGKVIEESAGEEVLRRIYGGQVISQAEFEGTYYRKALAVKNLIRKSFDQAFSKVDIIMSPTVPFFPHPLGQEVTDPLVEYAYDALTVPANLAGICAGVVSGEPLDDIPLGIQVMAPVLAEQLMCAAMYSFEQARK